MIYCSVITDYRTQEYFCEGKLMNRELFAKFFLAKIQVYQEWTVAYLPKSSFPIAFICMIHQNFPLPNFPMYGISCHLIKYQWLHEWYIYHYELELKYWF